MRDEKGRVAWLIDTLASVTAGVLSEGLGEAIHGAGDDCGVLRIAGPADLVIGSDYVRGVKFSMYEAGHMSLRDVGRFLVVANASDLAAMGADPVAFLAVVRYPPEMSDLEFEEVMRGIDEACVRYQLVLLGGDTGSAERLILSGTAVGLCPTGTYLSRDSAQPGDVLCVTGKLGTAGAAVAALQAGIVGRLNSPDWGALVRAWTEPHAQLDVGRALRKVGVRVACQDVSDGLRATARELGEASRVAVVLELGGLPVGEGVGAVAQHLGVEPSALAVSASTDFCICFACHPDDLPAVDGALRDVGASSWRVGRCELGAGVWVDSAGGRREAAPGAEWRHQPGDIGSVVSELTVGRVGLHPKPDATLADDGG